MIAVVIVNDLIEFFAHPPAFLAKLKDRPARSSVAPIVVLAITQIALFYIYYQWVNIEWLLEQMMADLPADQRASAADLLSRNVLFLATAITLPVILLCTIGLSALYFFLVAQIRGWAEGFGRWWTLNAWAALTTILLLPLGLLMIATGDGRLATDKLNPLALNVILGLPMESAWRTLAASISAVLVYNLAILVIGVRVWTGASMRSAALVVALPYIVIFGIWALIVLASGAL